MEQISFLEEKIPMTACVFTGHRELEKDFSLKQLKRLIETLILKGVSSFYCGMAEGFDLFASKTVISLKKKYPHIQLIACIPCLNQEKYFSSENKKLYVKMLSTCDEKVILSPSYHKGCMLNRNKYMVDRCDCMIAYCKKDTGGTAFTVKYFQKTKNKTNIFFL